MQQLIGYSKQKALKLKEDIRVYTDEDKNTELICIKARSVIDFGAGYDITDSQTGEAVCSFKREGLKSMLKDSWKVMDSSGNQIGTISEDSGLLAIVRRFVPFADIFVPQEFISQQVEIPSHSLNLNSGTLTNYSSKISSLLD